MGNRSDAVVLSAMFCGLVCVNRPLNSCLGRPPEKCDWTFDAVLSSGRSPAV